MGFYMKLTLTMISISVLVCNFTIFAVPQAKFKSTTFDCGNVTEGKITMLHAKFEIKNTGDEVLKITDVRPGCGCTNVKFDSTIAPGTSMVLKSDVNITGYQAGPVSKSIMFTSNSKKDPTVKLVIKADIIAPVSVSNIFISLNAKTRNKPYSIDLFSIKKDITITGVSFKVQNTSDAVSWKSNLPIDIKFSLSPTPIDTIRADKRYVHKLMMYTPAIAGVHHGEFIFKTNDPEKKEIVVLGIIGDY